MYYGQGLGQEIEHPCLVPDMYKPPFCNGASGVGQLSTAETAKRAAVAFTLVGVGLVAGIYVMNWVFRDWIEE